MKKNILFLVGGLLGVWVIGIILVNLFNIDLDKPGSPFNSNFFLAIFVVVAVAVLFFLIIGLFRHGAEKERELISENECLSRIYSYFGRGVTFPVALTLFFIFFANGIDLKKYIDPKYNNYTILGIGTFLSASGLPFIIRMLRLIRNEVKAVWVALLLIPYGFLLWVACIFLMMLIFVRGGCC